MPSELSERSLPAARRVLLTGFGPFPGVADNASARLVAALTPRARSAFPDCSIDYEILPTEWSAAPQRLRERLTALDPDVVLSFGVAHDAVGFRLETRGLNACRLTPDAAGLLPLSAALEAGGPPARLSSAPTGRIVQRLISLGHPVSLSNDAGGYLCNAIYYHALDHSGACGHHPLVAFVHVPADLASGTFSLETAIGGALEILALCLNAASINACGAGAGLASQ